MSDTSLREEIRYSLKCNQPDTELEYAWAHLLHKAAAALSPPALEGMVPVSVALNAVEHVGSANYESRVREARRWINDAAAPAPAQQAVTVDDAMIDRYCIAVGYSGKPWPPYIREGLEAALAPNAAGATPPATQEVG